MLKQPCPKGHSQTWQCNKGASAPISCQRCDPERKEADKRARKLAENQQRRDAKAQRHLKDIAKIQEEIDNITQSMKDKSLNDEHGIALAQKKKDLAAAKALASRAMNESSVAGSSATNSKPTNSTQPVSTSALRNKPTPPSSSTIASNSKKTLQDHLKTCLAHNVSPSKTEWQRQKDQEGAINPAIDSIMEMIGLEKVKSQVLEIKAVVDLSVRQGTDLKKERLGLVLLGNPGTGKYSGSLRVPQLTLHRQNNRCKTLRKSLDLSPSPFRGWLCGDDRLTPCAWWGY
jgi:hypothetical protein